MMRRHGCRHGPGRERGRRILRGIRSSGPREPISPTTAVRPTAAAVQTPRRHPRRVPHLRGPRDGLPTGRGVRPVFCCQNMAGGLRSEANSGCSRGAPTEASEALSRRQGSIRPPSTQTSPVPARSETGLAVGPGPPPSVRSASPAAETAVAAAKLTKPPCARRAPAPALAFRARPTT